MLGQEGLDLVDGPGAAVDSEELGEQSRGSILRRWSTLARTLSAVVSLSLAPVRVVVAAMLFTMTS